MGWLFKFPANWYLPGEQELYWKTAETHLIHVGVSNITKSSISELWSKENVYTNILVDCFFVP